MGTMREERIFGILLELSNRVASYITTMDDLQEDYHQGRRANMQIRKAAMKCIAMADTMMCRFQTIALENHVEEDWAICKVFHARRKKFNALELFFH